MIQIFVNPARVERVIFAPNSALEEDLDFAAWQAIRPLVNKIDRRLRGIVRDLQKVKRHESQKSGDCGR